MYTVYFSFFILTYCFTFYSVFSSEGWSVVNIVEQKKSDLKQQLSLSFFFFNNII